MRAAFTRASFCLATGKGQVERLTTREGGLKGRTRAEAEKGRGSEGIMASPRNVVLGDDEFYLGNCTNEQ
jgi:hypothetical protein